MATDPTRDEGWVAAHADVGPPLESCPRDTLLADTCLGDDRLAAAAPLGCRSPGFGTAFALTLSRDAATPDARRAALASVPRSCEDGALGVAAAGPRDGATYDARMRAVVGVVPVAASWCCNCFAWRRFVAAWCASHHKR